MVAIETRPSGLENHDIDLLGRLYNDLPSGWIENRTTKPLSITMVDPLLGTGLQPLIAVFPHAHIDVVLSDPGQESITRLVAQSSPQVEIVSTHEGEPRPIAENQDLILIRPQKVRDSKVWEGTIANAAQGLKEDGVLVVTTDQSVDDLTEMITKQGMTIEKHKHPLNDIDQQRFSLVAQKRAVALPSVA